MEEPGRQEEALGGTSTCWRRISPGGRSSWRSGWSAPPQGTDCQTPLPMPRAKPPGDYRAERIQRSLVGYRCVHSGPDSRLPSTSPGRLSEGVLLKKAALFLRSCQPGLPARFPRELKLARSLWLQAHRIPLLWLSGDKPVRGSGGRDLSLCPQIRADSNTKSAQNAGTLARANGRETQAWTIIR